MREVIKTAKTVEEATELALAELGASAEEAEIEVLELPQRKLFRSIPAKVRAYIEEKEEEEIFAPRAETPKAAASRTAAPKVETPAPREPERSAIPQKPAMSELKEEAAPEQPEEVIDLSQNQKARDAVEYLREVCAKMGADRLEITPVRQGEATVLRIEGEGTGTLIGHRGEVMEALSYLTSLVANRSGGDYMKISLDINHYRSKREANLVALAKRIGAKVARTGRGHTLEPMNPYERRIIHSTISELEGVKSESIGEGANRRVVISCTNPNARPPRDNRDNRTGRGGRGPRGGRDFSGRDASVRAAGGRGQRRDGGRGPRTSTPPREFADRPRDPSAAPVVPSRTETINDGADLPLYGKIEL